MPNRFFIAICSTEDRQRDLADRARGYGLISLIDRPGLFMAAEHQAASVMLGGGVIIGTVHTLGRRQAVRELPVDTIMAILAGRGDYLVRACWGDYVALFADPQTGRVDILRAPFGALPCLYASGSNATFVASDVELLEQLAGFQPKIDRERLTRFAISPDMRFGETCMRGLDEVRGGDRLTVTGGTTTLSTLWSPWTFAEPARQFDDRVEAARRLHDEINSAMACVTDDIGRGVILLSGGLDSSIVTASAAASGMGARCVTVSTNVAAGDERAFARRTAEHAGVPLAERSFELGGVDLSYSGAMGLPRPVARAFEYEGRRQARIEATAFGTDAILSGGGGDNIFCSMQSVAPATDVLHQFGMGPEFWRTAREISDLTGASLFTVARRAWFRARQRRRQYPVRTIFEFLDPAVTTRAELHPHPWLQRPMSVLQGKGAHVANLLGVQMLTEDSDPRDPSCLRFPLLAQPVVELCLCIPSWFWFDRGCNRAVARHAFAESLPPDIAWRRSKGTPDGFVVDLYDTHRAQIRAMLTDGNLAALGLLDLQALTTTLDDPRPVRGTDHGRIMRLVDIEAWTRSW